MKLEPVRAADSERLFAWINDRELVLLSSAYSPVHEAGHSEWFESIRSRDDVVIFAIRRVADDELIGTCQLLSIDRRHRSAELQIRIGEPQAQGHGLGTEAVELLLGHAFDDLDLQRVQLHVFATNERAIRAYEKSGFEREGVLRDAVYVDGARLDVVVMAKLRLPRSSSSQSGA